MKINRLEQRKNSVEKTLKDFNVPYTTECDRRFFKIIYQEHKFGTNWFVEYYELLYNNLLDINIDKFFKIKTEKQGSKVLVTTNGILYSVNG